MKQKTGFVLFCILALFSLPALSQGGPAFDRYHSPEELNRIIRQLGQNDNATIHELTETAGGYQLLLLEIGPETGKDKKELPAIFTAANLEGTVPLAGEAALYLASQLLEKPEMAGDKTWYILACGNQIGRAHV